eukprot:TCONS_00015383-protein
MAAENGMNISVRRSKMVVRNERPARIHSIKTNEPVIPRIRATKMTARSPVTIADVRKPTVLIVQLQEEQEPIKSPTNLGEIPLGKKMSLTGVQEPLMLGTRL